MDGHVARRGDDGRDGCPKGLDYEILGEKDARQHEVRDEEGPDEDKAVESVVGKDDGVGN